MKVRILTGVRPAALLLLLLSAAGCTRVDGQDEFEQDALAQPAGYTRTGTTGQLLDLDGDDWRISPLYNQLVFVNPPFPNPTQGQRLVWEFSFSGTPALRALDVYHLSTIGRRYLGSYLISNTQFLEVIRLDPVALSLTGLLGDARGLQRVIFYDQNGRVVTYGDIFVDV